MYFPNWASKFLFAEGSLQPPRFVLGVSCLGEPQMATVPVGFPLKEGSPKKDSSQATKSEAIPGLRLSVWTGLWHQIYPKEGFQGSCRVPKHFAPCQEPPGVTPKEKNSADFRKHVGCFRGYTPAEYQRSTIVKKQNQQSERKRHFIRRLVCHLVSEHFTWPSVCRPPSSDTEF